MILGFKNAGIFSMDDSRENSFLPSGWLTVEEGRIKEIGSGIEVPGYCDKVIDLEGRIITPGLIDAHTHLGLYEEGNAKEGDDTNETSAPSTPHLRAIDGISPRDIGFQAARESGVTCVGCLPGSTNVIGGLGTVVKTTDSIVERMVLLDNCGLKVAFGENPKRVYGEKNKTPVTRMAVAGLLREKFVQALEWQREKEKEHEKEKRSIFPEKRDLQHESFIAVLRGDIPLRVHAHRADDMMTAIRISEEFGVKIILEHCMEGRFIAREIAARNIPVVYGPMFLGRVKQELREMDEVTPVLLSQAGIKLAITTDHPELSIKHLSLSAAVAVREGLDEIAALKAITINAAEILGVASKVGSLVPGKDADLAIWTGMPFELRSKVGAVLINGSPVYDALSIF